MVGHFEDDCVLSMKSKDRLKTINERVTGVVFIEKMSDDKIEKELNVDCYFAYPYRSYERGINENSNGLIRRYFPKGTDFALITYEEIKKVEYCLNTKPRKRLAWSTPYEVYYKLTGVAIGG